MSVADSTTAVETVFRMEFPRVVASLARLANDLDLAEELAQEALLPSPIVELNRAVAISMASGPAGALPLVELGALERYHLLHAVRGDLLRRRAAESAARAATPNIQ